ncbi:MAG: cold shock domain-containing protein [Flavobacteriales bacterium]|nr:cold shock domain-containing protein [Flavobacteriales bacterium]NNK81404.1 cold shock domain-containing protein [Flavobacteriales bacterium]
MGRSQETFGKKEREKKRAKKREDKLKKKLERKENNLKGEGLDSMITFVDEFGNPTDTPPDLSQREEIAAEDIVIGIPKKEEGEQESPFKDGTVEFFNHDKGFGFIKEIGTGEKYFVHISQCEEEINEGNRVSFELERGPKGMNAVRVKLG